MKFATMMVATAALLAAPAALAQDYGSQTRAPDPQTRATDPQGGAYGGYLDSRDIPQQEAQLPAPGPEPRADAGTLRKYNSNRGGGPEVQFDVDREEAAKRARERQQYQEQWR